MPSNRTRRTRQRTVSDGLKEADYIYFAYGPFFEAEGYEDGKTEEQLKATWKKHHMAILRRHSQEMQRKGKWSAGCRPWAYLDWDRTEERLTLQGTREELIAVSRNQEGMPSYDYYGKESDYAYLKRLCLLYPWELEAWDVQP